MAGPVTPLLIMFFATLPQMRSEGAFACVLVALKRDVGRFPSLTQLMWFVFRLVTRMHFLHCSGTDFAQLHLHGQCMSTSSALHLSAFKNFGSSFAVTAAFCFLLALAPPRFGLLLIFPHSGCACHQTRILPCQAVSCVPFSWLSPRRL